MQTQVRSGFEDEALPARAEPAEMSAAQRAPAARVLGVGGALPERILTNAELATFVDTSDEWIVSRTGIRERRIAADGQTTSDLAAAAARAALANANLSAEAVDLIVLATATPDHTFPATAVIVQEKLGITRGAAFDIGAVCSGFVYALSTAEALIAAGRARCALVIGAETFSRILDWSDRTTCVLFGDGAGAVVLGAADEGRAPGAGRALGEGRAVGEGAALPRVAAHAAPPRGILASALRSDGRHRDKLFVDGGPSTTQSVGHLRMRGQEVFRFAVAQTVDVVEDVLANAGLRAQDVDWFVPHQANQRIIDASAKKLGIAPEKVVLTVDRHGNTSAASVPLALADKAAKAPFRPGELVLIEAMGGGFTWGACLLRW